MPKTVFSVVAVLFIVGCQRDERGQKKGEPPEKPDLTQTTGKRVEERIGQLEKANKDGAKPDNDREIYLELLGVEKEVAAHQKRLTIFQEGVRRYQQASHSAKKIIPAVAERDGFTEDEKRGVLAEVARLKGFIYGFYPELIDLNDPWHTVPTHDFENMQLAIKKSEQKLFQYIDDLKRQYQEQILSDVTPQRLTYLIELLLERKSFLQQKLIGPTPQESLIEKLWLIILIIGGLCLLAMTIVKFVDGEIQYEWIVSGQLVQFITVMILLSVVMGLGIAGTLKEQTLGTLLGGIAGYVLAQGVGRAAAQSAVRQIQSQTKALGGASARQPKPEAPDNPGQQEPPNKERADEPALSPAPP